MLLKQPDKSGSTEGNPALRALSLLFEALALHTVSFDPQELETFQTAIRRLDSRLRRDEDPSDAMTLAADAIGLMQGYYRKAEQSLNDQRREMVMIVRMMLTELHNASTSKDRANLLALGTAFSAAQTADALREVKSKLSQALESSRDDNVSAVLEPGRGADGEVDEVTGLPGQRASLAAVSKQLSQQPGGFLAVFCLRHLQAINAKFGSEAGDQMLMLLGQHLQMKLQEAGHLSRWPGATLVALMQPGATHGAVHADVVRAVSSRVSYEVTFQGRRLSLPFTLRWSILPVATGQTPADIAEKVHTFARDSSGRE